MPLETGSKHEDATNSFETKRHNSSPALGFLVGGSYIILKQREQY
jgi:hypothetical protein